jgi:Flavin-binding monooxygenase-like
MAPLKLAVIGGGPGAMFFCHSYHKQRQNQETTLELQITCFEKKASPGGVWRASKEQDSSADDATANADDTRIYDELWTNGASQAIEFYDYTYQDHFGSNVQLPVFFPRKDVHEYIVSRVTKDHPHFFEEFFQLNTEVTRVSYDDDNGKFTLTLQDARTQQTRCEVFDKCIWAGGENGIKHIPRSLRELFPTPTAAAAEESPLLLHSTETHAIRQHTPGQTILLVGGGYSAEDLALQCLKWGAAKVHISTRCTKSCVTWTTSWPADKVEVYKGVAIRSVEGRTIEFEGVKWQWPDGYVARCEEEDEEEESLEEAATSDDTAQFEDEKKEADSLTAPSSTFESTESSDEPPTLTDVALVIFCTGYKANLDMLDPPLRPTNDCIPQFNMGEMPFDSELLNEDWRMAKGNPAEPFTGHVPPCQGRMNRVNYNHPDMHRGIFLPNPNMMFICEHGSDAPLLSLDVHAWLLCSYLTGRLPMPSVQELRAANEQQLVHQLGLPFLRYLMDERYCQELDKLGRGFWHPTDESVDDNCAWWKCEIHYDKYQLRLLAKIMEEGKYPGASLGDYEKLNDNGKAIYNFGNFSYQARTYREDDEGEDRQWRTFRDDERVPSLCYSLYSKIKARPLKKKWFDAIGDVSIRAGDV